MMKLWGRTSSINVQKILWCMHELGLREGTDYERIDAGLQFGINNTPEFLEINPNGLIPTIQDGQLVLWESNTILRYLARKYDQNNRFPADINSQASADKWMDWQLTTFWPKLHPVFLGLTRIPEEERNYALIRSNYETADALLQMLEKTLQKSLYCAGSRFSLADIVLALAVNRWIILAEKFPERVGQRTSYPAIEAWMKRLESETAYLKVAK
jgi:glutathione S-transferase